MKRSFPPEAPEPAVPASHWLPRHRVTIPEPPARYCDRPELTRRCAPTDRPVTVLMAPGGFGKTTLLAEACRRAVARSMTVAWVTLSRDDDPGALDAYFAFAFREAGVDFLEALDRGDNGAGRAYPRTALLMRALEERHDPCILALDELEHASGPAAVGLLNHLFRNAPPCLHIAIACRELPPGLDLAQPVLGRHAAVLTAEDLRFSKPDIARFFDLELSRDQLAAVAAESNGWPIALRIRHNEPGRQQAAGTRAARHVVDNWIAGRFWEGFCNEDRELILDIGLLEWADAALAEEVFEDPHALDRLLALPRLAGRGATLDAMWHATLAGDTALAGRIFLNAGALQWWLREGSERLLAAVRLIPSAADEPRIAMTRCVALFLQGRLRDAQRAFANAPSRPESPGLEIDRLLARGLLATNDCEPLGEEDAKLMEATVTQIAERPDTPTLVRGALAYGRSIFHARQTEFATSVALARRARKAFVGRSAYLTMMIDTHLGQIGMVRGQVREALRRYRSAARIAKARFVEEPRLTLYPALLLNELALERNHMHPREDPRRIARDVYLHGCHFSQAVVVAGLATDLALELDGTHGALALVEDMAESARQAGIELLQQHLAALRVSLLADARDVDAAQRTWRASELPETDAGCLAIGAGGWRELEAVACARILLLNAAGKSKAAGDLARALALTAKERGLRRTLMRALALRVRLCHRAGDRNAAMEAGTEYLALYARSDYARPLVLAGTAAATALDRIIDAEPDGPNADAAERLLAMGRDRVPAKPQFTVRQKAVLGRLVSQQDKEIAAALGMTPYGVRYHIRAIFKRLGVHNRADAVRRARALGVFAATDDGYPLLNPVVRTACTTHYTRAHARDKAGLSRRAAFPRDTAPFAKSATLSPGTPLPGAAVSRQLRAVGAAYASRCLPGPQPAMITKRTQQIEARAVSCSWRSARYPRRLHAPR